MEIKIASPPQPWPTQGTCLSWYLAHLFRQLSHRLLLGSPMDLLLLIGLRDPAVRMFESLDCLALTLREGARLIFTHANISHT